MAVRIRDVLGQIFSKPGHLILALIVAIFFYLLNVLIQNYSNLVSFLMAYDSVSTLFFFSQLTLGFHKTIEAHSVVTLVLTSILLGILVTIIVFKAKNTKSQKSSSLGAIAVFLGLLAPGCAAACGIGLIAALGLSSIVLTFLPFEGLELSVLAIIILVFAIFKTSKDLTVCEVCRVNFKTVTLKKMKGGKI
ncbi:hypothetical protein CO038_02810 [Candidatus Pacearchaeota archaeon CG_4_9_14_0_2_um_filter_39_13]|nr:hypothetical protein [Candidatus Pacearchaeota archaeon]OIO42865.1 MAG: hypothetical protein AUJ64_03445 [Candidatus Pacearchaeota archaeon CG1_02_39_14]PJC44618.1 MAG: hypothetical protein CO038_02810 [Candidatus Pacearchaeota archaeon CG_4_9_14_0_2_um_filter_39_13]